MRKASVAAKLALPAALILLFVPLSHARYLSQTSVPLNASEPQQILQIVRQSCDDSDSKQSLANTVQLADTILALCLTLLWMGGELINHYDSDFHYWSLNVGCFLRPIWLSIVSLGLLSLAVDIAMAATLNIRIEAAQPVAIAALLAFVLRNWMARSTQSQIGRKKLASFLRTKKVRYGIIEGPLKHSNYVIDPHVPKSTLNSWKTEKVFREQQILGGKNQDRSSLRTKQVWTLVREMNCNILLIRATLWADWLPTRAIEEVDWKKILQIPRVHGALKSSVGLTVLKGVGVPTPPNWLTMDFWLKDGWLAAALWAAECHESVEKVWKKALELIPEDGSALPSAETFVSEIESLMLDKTYRDWGD